MAVGDDVVDLQHRAVQGHLGLVEEVRELPPDHHRADRLVAEAAPVQLADEHAVAQHHGARRQAADLLEAVGDEDHAEAAGDELLDHDEELLGVGQAGGGLVEDEDRRIDGDGLGHLRQLALPLPETGETGSRVDVAEPHTLEVRAGLSFEVTPSHPAHGTPQAGQQDVLGDAQVRDRRRLLTHQGDPRLEPVARSHETALVPVEQDPAVVGGHRTGDDPGEGRGLQVGHGARGDVVKDQRQRRHAREGGEVLV